VLKSDVYAKGETLTRMKKRDRYHWSVDASIVKALVNSGTNFVCSVPCSLLSGVLDELSKGRTMITHVPVTREEEGVGICAGAFLGGGRPALLMQNSGLGNSLNALLSLTSFYELGLFLLIGFRGRVAEERIRAQVPMGDVTQRMLTTMNAEFDVIERVEDIPRIETLSRLSYEGSKVTAALLPPGLWK